MKKSLAIAWLCVLCFPVFGQATYSGTMVHQGTLTYGGASGVPLTYAARTDNCETGSESGCILGTSVGQQGATLSYLGRAGDTLPSLGGLSGAGDGSAHCVTDPDFGAVICRLTDYTHFSSAGLSFNLGSDGEQHRFSADSPPSFLLAGTGGGANALIGLTYSGSGSSTAVTSMLTALYGAQLPASGYVFSMQTANVLWELVQGQYTPAGAVNSPPTPCSSGTGCEYVDQINKLILGCTSGTIPLCAGGSLVVSRTKVFDFNCEGAGCPASSANQNVSGGHNIGTDSPNCLPANWDATWNGSFMVSDDDTSVTVAFSDNGQGGQPGTGSCTKGSSAGSCLGAVYLANFTFGNGCRALNTHTMSATGGYGPTGAMINSQPNVITGIANQVLPDTFDMHDGNQLPDPSYAVFVPGALPACAAPPTVNLQSFTTDSGGTPTFTTATTNSFFVGQTT
jgi:hypothetical protein